MMDNKEVGLVGNLDAAHRLKAFSLIQQGKVYDLECQRWNLMPLYPGHPPFQVLIYRTPQGLRNQQDHQDFLGQNEPQFAWLSDLVMGTVHTGTHIDALSHVCCGSDGHWYGGFSAAEHLGDFGPLKADATTIPPIITRGVMIDVCGYLDKGPLPKGYPIRLDEVKGALDHQGTQIQPGDVVLVRTGYMAVWPKPERSEYVGAGITLEVGLYLAEQGAIVVGADTEACEVLPSIDPTNPHPVHIALLIERGIHIIEMAYQEELARDKVYEFLFIAIPHKIKGATGSFIRPLAIV